MVIADALILLLGIALLIGGGEAMVRGAAALARQLGVPPLVVGLTVVAFGTSAPELAVNVTAAVRGNGAVAFGNLVGSNLANVGLILAISALLRPIDVQSVVVTREIPMMLLASVVTVVMGLDVLRGEAASAYDRPEGLLLLLFFGVFLYYTIADTLRRRTTDPLVEQAREHPAGERLTSLVTSGALVVLGLVALTLGGRFTVAGAVEIATALGAPKGLIGLTVVAVGTSLPELSASLMAARRGGSLWRHRGHRRGPRPRGWQHRSLDRQRCDARRTRLRRGDPRAVRPRDRQRQPVPGIRQQRVRRPGEHRRGVRSRAFDVLADRSRVVDSDRHDATQGLRSDPRAPG